MVREARESKRSVVKLRVRPRSKKGRRFMLIEGRVERAGV